jgi:hypothetical protein
MIDRTDGGSSFVCVPLSRHVLCRLINTIAC